ncbi:ABC-three component system protein [Erythrobacter sp. W53]|uniref:ABC-three component system protein n=1 Tax=Erythrobacter sp. W53 TaxID=3425947 RepID=UPI003D767F5B
MEKVSQQHSSAGGDIVGGDKVTTTYNSAPKGKIEKLLLKLKEQYDGDHETQSIIDELAHYHTRRAPDGIFGLEAKLEAAGKGDIFEDAIEKKEMFAKLLQKWTMYSSAQLIFAHILAKAEVEFTQVIYPQIPEKTEADINALVIDRIVNPIVEECGDDLLAINHNLVQGMVYWLAEQCFIRWHHSSKVTQ